jgi:hypothetical protein
LSEEVKKQLSENGCKISKKELSEIKKRIKSADKKYKSCFEFLEFEGKKDKEEDKQERGEDETIEVPMMMAFGITVALCGVFLCVLPIPAAKAWGVDLIKTGVMIAAEEGIRHRNDDKKKDK